MREFDYSSICETLLTPEMEKLLEEIHEEEKQLNAFLTKQSEGLSLLSEKAEKESIAASNALEQIRVTPERLDEILKTDTPLRTDHERLIAGYRDAFRTVTDSYDAIPMTASVILQLHRDLYRYMGYGGGCFKTGDNVIREQDSKGNQTIRFRPVSAWETPAYVVNICQAFEKASEKNTCDPLLRIPVFILDFLCVHPFDDGNGRTSRILTALLLYQAGCFAGMYSGMDRMIEKHKDGYYESLQRSSENWHEGENDYGPFARCILQVLLETCMECRKVLQNESKKYEKR